MSRSQILRFLIGEHSRFGNKPNTQWYLERKARPAALYDIDRQLGMLPELKLVLRHIKIAARDFAQPNIRRPDHKLALRITHRRRPVTAPAGLVEHEIAVFFTELRNDRSRFVSNFNSREIFHFAGQLGGQVGFVFDVDGVR